jgi:hypothetical protein
MWTTINRYRSIGTPADLLHKQKRPGHRARGVNRHSAMKQTAEIFAQYTWAGRSRMRILRLNRDTW